MSDISSQKRKSDGIFSLYGSDDEDDSKGNGFKTNELKRVKSDQLAQANIISTHGEHNSSVESLMNCFLLSVCAARKGEREEMQDRHLLIDSFHNRMESLLDPQGVNGRFAFYALFDGHGGMNAADYCEKNFVIKFVEVSRKYIKQNSGHALFEKFMKKIFIETYKLVDDEFLTEAKKSKPALRDGTTSTTVLLMNESIFCANIGDSKAVICRYKPVEKELMALQLTVDHNPMIFDERMRIQKVGGCVKDGRVMGILEVSRSIGDGNMKSHGVICTPDVKKLTLCSNDIFLILACDGLWKVFTQNSASLFVLDSFKRRIALNSNEDETSIWNYISDEICAEAIRKGCGDNVSVIIVVFVKKEEINKIINDIPI